MTVIHVIDLPYAGDYDLTDNVAQAGPAAFVSGMSPGPGGGHLDMAFVLEGPWGAAACA